MNRSHTQAHRSGDGVAWSLPLDAIVADLRLGWSLRVERKPEVVLSTGFPPHLKQESTKVVGVFNTVVLVPGIVQCMFEA
jgi:hypothetical protein